MLLQMAYFRHVLLRCVSLARIMTGVMYAWIKGIDFAYVFTYPKGFWYSTDGLVIFVPYYIYFFFKILRIMIVLLDLIANA
jgi:hypothetical protein